MPSTRTRTECPPSRAVEDVRDHASVVTALDPTFVPTKIRAPFVA